MQPEKVGPSSINKDQDRGKVKNDLRLTGPRWVPFCVIDRWSDQLVPEDSCSLKVRRSVTLRARAGISLDSGPISDFMWSSDPSSLCLCALLLNGKGGQVGLGGF